VAAAKTGNDGRYTISLPLGKVYVVVVEKAASDGSATINIKNIAHEENPEVDITPVTSVAVEAISQNITLRETLTAVNNGSGGNKPDVSAVAGAIDTAKENVETYYESHQSEIIDVTATTPPSVPSIPNLIEEYTLTVGVSPNAAVQDGVTVNLPPAPNASGKYLKGTKVTLRATSGSASYRFEEWTGADAGDVENNEITITGTKNITAKFARTDGARLVDEIDNIDTWAWDDSWNIGETSEDYSNKKRPTDGITGVIVQGLKVGKKDNNLYFMAKLLNGESPSENCRYQFIVLADTNNDNYINAGETMVYVNVTHGAEGDGGQWVHDYWRARSDKEIGDDGAEYITPNVAELVRVSADIIVAAIPISTIKEILGDKPYYNVMMNTARNMDGGWNYYRLELRKVAF
jgi:hypothetical protein